jgi:hypothetical protein
MIELMFKSHQKEQIKFRYISKIGKKNKLYLIMLLMKNSFKILLNFLNIHIQKL